MLRVQHVDCSGEEEKSAHGVEDKPSTLSVPCNSTAI